MTNHVAIFVCDNETKAEAARLELVQDGFDEDNITAELATTIRYNAKAYSSGGNPDLFAQKWLVIGRKP